MKNRLRLTALSTVLLGLCLQSSGCMTFQFNDARKFDSFPPSIVAARSTKATIHLDATY